MRTHFALLTLILAAFVLRVAALDAKGLAYDEAATALMARAAPAAIIAFHWDAAFEHPPLWQLLMAGWSRLAGQHEFALRFLPLLAGVLQTPLLWILLQRLPRGPQPSPTGAGQDERQSPILLACLLLALSPVLILYSQEARMYTLVGALALASLWFTLRLADRPKWTTLFGFALVNWAMTTLHYYSVLLVGVEALWLGWLMLWDATQRRRWPYFAGALVAALLPITLWLALAPSFHETVAVVLRSVRQAESPGVAPFLSNLWLDLSFGAIRWRPETVWVGYLLLPPCLIGAGVWAWAAARAMNSPGAPPAQWRGWLLLLTALAPILLSALLFQTLATRYILFIAPMLYLLAASGVMALYQWRRSLGVVALLLPLAVAGAGLIHYFTLYTKSDYRTMAQHLAARLAPTDGILLEAPRQHLLAKYYLSTERPYYTAPVVDLPAFWPVNAPPVVPEAMDDVLQAALRRHRTLWFIQTAEDEVDKGEFVAKYLTAVSFRAECHDWLDVRLCRHLSPHFIPATRQRRLQALFGHELLLIQSSLTVTTEADGQRFLLAILDWLAQAKPTVDYRVTLRLVNAQGALVQQLDDYPIGPLLPPTTWNAADAKPGFMALPLPADLPPGSYPIIAGVYDPATAAPISYVAEQGATGDFLVLGQAAISAQPDGITIQ